MSGDNSALKDVLLNTKKAVCRSCLGSDLHLVSHTHVKHLHAPMLSLRRVPTTMVQSVETTCLTLVFKRITDVDRQLFRKMISPRLLINSGVMILLNGRQLPMQNE